MNKPATAQELIDWIRDYLEMLEDEMILPEIKCTDDEPRVILAACKAFLEALEETRDRT